MKSKGTTTLLGARAIEHTSVRPVEAKEAEALLAEMGFWTGAVDGVFDPATRAALIAFQKWEGRAITGKLTIDELEAIRASALINAPNANASPNARSGPRARETGYAHAEVDLDRQVMLLVNEKGDVRVLPVSTGSGKPFIEDGQTSVAYTPRGRFLVYDKTVGWETGALGSMYYSNYISGGVAIHGHPNVPNEPASHGCIRIPMFAAREVSRLLSIGTIVLVYDKVSFVSAKEWVENPDLKRSALLESARPDHLALDRVRGWTRDGRANPRLKTDEAIKKVGAAGSVIGITGVHMFVKGDEPTTIEHVLDDFDHVRKLIGAEHLGVGSDMDLYGYDAMPAELNKRLRASYKGSYGFREKIDIDGINHPKRVFDLTEGLIRRSYSNGEIEGILGGNFARVLSQIWEVTPEQPAAPGN